MAFALARVRGARYDQPATGHVQNVALVVSQERQQTANVWNAPR